MSRSRAARAASSFSSSRARRQVATETGPRFALRAQDVPELRLHGVGALRLAERAQPGLEADHECVVRGGFGGRGFDLALGLGRLLLLALRDVVARQRALRDRVEPERSRGL